MDQSFRDSIATIDDEGKRKWIYPKKPKGRFFNARSILSVVLLAFLFAGPFIRINGRPLLLLNILERKFVFFGQVFWPQDFYIFAFAMITMVLFVVLFTVVFGRLFCGWVCPQTIFMEMVFRKIEYWIEGDYKQQKALNKKPWNAEKVGKKGLKHTLFFLISFLIANTFLAYLIGSGELIATVTDNPMNQLGTLGTLLIFTGVFYGVFAFFREQVCIVACPYGRLQGVLLDKHSVVVAYDHERGESRAKFRKNEVRQEVGKGDCIDCHQCVDVCPTGIDIRNGTQLECVNCTACIDACDHMMDGVGLDRGLIRYASEAQISEREKFYFTTRTKAYSGVLLLLMGVLVGLILSRADVETSILRTPGMLFQEQDNGMVSNLYNVKLINKTYEAVPVELRLINQEGEIKMVGTGLEVGKEGVAEAAMFIYLPRSEIKKMKTKVKVGVYSNGELLETVSTTFLGPVG